ncbi:MAG: hypothetical protein J6B12_03905 [Clostridia bacterium]|nr:hypothetical protein [Clostridia bacterium]
MRTYTKEHGSLGRLLFAECGRITVGVALDYGIRIPYLSYDGSENLFFEQPREMTDLCTPDGWRVYGGHRLWLAPEGKHDYYPDNDAVTVEVLENGLKVSQKNDPWICAEKQVEIRFCEDDRLEILHTVKNTDKTKRRVALWAVTSMAPLGTEYIPLALRDGGSDPNHVFTTWDYTSLGDERARYERELITLSHRPTGKKYKIGVGHPLKSVRYVNRGVVFEKLVDVREGEQYTDGGVSFETFMCDHMVEVETLSPLMDMDADESVAYLEVWKLSKE